MNKLVLAGIIIILVITAVALFVFPKNDAENIAQQEREPSTSTEAYTLNDVALHDNAQDCWTVIGDNVYDITDFIAQHPGGDEILRACGNDATTLFETRTTNDGETVGSGTPHSVGAQNTLGQYQIGALER